MNMASATHPEKVVASLASLLRATPPIALAEARRRIAKLDRTDIIDRYRAAYAGEKLLATYLMAVELVERGVPPFCWHQNVPTPNDASVGQRRILVLGDLTWLRHWHPDHHKEVRYQRGKAMLTGSETMFVREAEYAFHDGKRPVWQIVAKLSMSEQQQFEVAYLRSAPVKRKVAAIDAMSKRVLDALRDSLSKTRRVSFGLAEALESAERQHTLWRCSRMVPNGSPTKAAQLYEKMTGIPITRQVAAKQLAKVLAVLCKRRR